MTVTEWKDELDKTLEDCSDTKTRLFHALLAQGRGSYTERDEAKARDGSAYSKTNFRIRSAHSIKDSQPTLADFLSCDRCL